MSDQQVSAEIDDLFGTKSDWGTGSMSLIDDPGSDASLEIFLPRDPVEIERLARLREEWARDHQD